MARLPSELPTLSTKKEEIGAHQQRVTWTGPALRPSQRSQDKAGDLWSQLTWEQGKVLGVYGPRLVREPWRQLLFSAEALNPGLRSR